MTDIRSSLTIALIDDVTGPSKAVANALKNAEKQAKDMAKAMADSGLSTKMVGALQRIGASAADIKAVGAAWKDYVASANLASTRTADWTKAQRTAVRGWENSTILALRNVRKEEAAFARASQRAHEVVERSHAKPGLLAGVAHAGAAYVSAHAILRGTERVIEPGAEREHVRTQMANAGMRPEELRRAEASAITAQRGAPNLTVSDVMELHKEARSALPHPEEAFQIINDLAKAASILKGMGVENANIADLVKGGESLGLMNDPKRFHGFLEGQVKAMNVMGKTITTEQIYEAAKYSKSAGATLSDEFINLTLPSLIQEMHGSSAGDALSMLTKTLRGGLQHKHLPVQKLNDLGLLEEPDKIRYNKAGTIMGYAGKVRGDDLIASDPQRWAEEIFKPAAERAGYRTLTDQVRLLNETLPSTAANLIRILLQQEEGLRQHRENYSNAPGLNEAAQNQRGDPVAALGAVTASLKDFAAAVTSPVMQTAGQVLSSVAGSIEAFSGKIAEFSKAHPDIAPWLSGGAIAGGVAGAGYAGKKLLDFVSGGFGLSASAAALDESAAALTAAATRLGATGAGAAAVANSVPKVAPTVVPTATDLVAGSGATAAVSAIGAVGIAALAKATQQALDAGFKTWMPQGRDQIDDIKQQIAQNQADIDGIRSRTHPSRQGDFNPDIDRLEKLNADLTNRLDAAKAQAAQAGQDMQTSLNISAAPEVDTGAIDLAIGKANELKSILVSIGPLSQGTSSSLSGAIGKTMRGNFTAAGVQGE